MDLFAGRIGDQWAVERVISAGGHTRYSRLRVGNLGCFCMLTNPNDDAMMLLPSAS
jgi:hypothetical protein